DQGKQPVSVTYELAADPEKPSSMKVAEPEGDISNSIGTSNKNTFRNDAPDNGTQLSSLLSHDDLSRWHRVATNYLARKRVNGAVIDGQTSDDFIQNCMLTLWQLYRDTPRRFPNRYIDRICDTVLDRAYRRAELWRHPVMRRAANVAHCENSRAK